MNAVEILLLLFLTASTLGLLVAATRKIDAIKVCVDEIADMLDDEPEGEDWLRPWRTDDTTMP